MSLPVVFRPEAVDRIRSMPEAYAAVYGNVSRGIVHRFPL